ncbi:MAG: hypothetical protein ACFN3C_03465, partial [Stomatobaculum longum]
MQKSLYAAMVAFFLSGFAMGNGYTGLQSRAAPTPVCAAQYSRRIAVVNLDNGIRRGEKYLYYAADAMEFPDTDFVSVSMPEAESGVRSGYYAAYLVIPGDFSEKVDSISRHPEQATVRYRLSAELSQSERAELQRRLDGFGERMNQNIVYLYFHAVLGEFHGAQDAVQTALRNQAEELKHVKGLGSEQWIQHAELPERPEGPEETASSQKAELTRRAYDALLAESEQEARLLTRLLDEREQLEKRMEELAEEGVALEAIGEAGEQKLQEQLSLYRARIEESRGQLTEKLASNSNAGVLHTTNFLSRTASASNAVFLASPSEALSRADVSFWREERNRLASASNATRDALHALEGELTQETAFPEETMKQIVANDMVAAMRQRRETTLTEIRRESETFSNAIFAAEQTEADSRARRSAQREAVRQEREQLQNSIHEADREQREAKQRAMQYSEALYRAFTTAEQDSESRVKAAVGGLQEKLGAGATENERLFGSFSKKLPHTRNGSLPNKESYEKMAAPLALREEKPGDVPTVPVNT